MTLLRRTAATLLVFAATAVCAQPNYPQRPVRLLVPASPGGAMDIVGRIIAPKLADELGQPIVVDNRGGAAGNIGIELLARATPDGYTVMIGNIGNIALNPGLYPNFPVKPVRDLTAITQIAATPDLLIANPAAPFRSVRELIDYAKANPGKLNVGSLAGNRVQLEYFTRAARIDMTSIQYKGGAGPAMIALIGNEISLMFAPLSTALTYVTGGRLAALAVVAPARAPALPNLPTMIEAGFPGLNSGAWQGLFVPRATPPAIVERLYRATSKVMADAEIRRRLGTIGVEATTNASPEAFSAFVKSETGRWAAVISEAGMKGD